MKHRIFFSEDSRSPTFWVLPKLYELIEYAKSFTKIEDNAINAIKLARKSLLFNKDGTWLKKVKDMLFDVTKGSFDEA